MPQMMENPAFERDGVVASGSGSATVRSVELDAVEPRNGVICTDLCRTQLHHQQQQLQATKQSPPSPWNPLKTIFLATIIGILVVWVIVFTTLSQLGFF